MPNNILNKWSNIVLVLAALLASSACQPSVDERFERASQAFAEHDYRAATIDLKSVLQERPEWPEARQMLADASFVLSDFGTAETQYRRVIERDESNREAWIGYGRTLLQQGRAAEALEKVSPSLEGFEGDAEALAVLGDIVAALGNMEAATGYYEAALAINPTEEPALIGLARIEFTSGELIAADERLETALAAHPDSPSVWRTKADLYQRRGSMDESITAYRKSIDLERPTDSNAEKFLTRRNLLATLLDSGKYEEATPVVDELNAMAPGHPLVRFFRGNIAFGLNDHQTAEAELLEYLAVIPNDPRAHALLGAINFSKNSLGQAEEYLSSALEANVGGDQIRFLLAETQLRLNKPGDARNYLREAEAYGESDAVLLAMLGRASAGEGDTAAAIEYLERSRALDGQSPSVNLALASSYVRAARLDDAIRILEPMPVGTNGDYRREYLLISAYIQNQMADSADDVGKALIEKNPEDANAHALVGVLQEKIGNLGRAQQHFERSLAIDPDNVGALYSMAMADVAGDRTAEGIQKFEKLLAGNPAHLLALVQLAAVYETEGSLDKMLPKVNAALAAAPDVPALLSFAARVNIALSRSDEAISQLQRGLVLSPDDPRLHHLLGVAFMQSGQMVEALASLAAAANAAPENGRYQLDLSRAYLASGDFAKSVAAARAFRELHPRDTGGLVLEIDGLLRTGNIAAARDAVAEFAEQNPDEKLTLIFHGDIELYEGNTARALSLYELYAKSNWDRMVLNRLILAHRAAGGDGALAVVEKWLDDHPDDSEIRRMYGQLLESSGSVDRAITEYEKLLNANQLDAVGMNNLAWHYSVAGNPDAIKIARRAHELDPENGSISDTYGWILYEQGDVAGALEILRNAADQSPNNGEIQYHLAVVLAASGARSEAREIIDDLLASEAPFASRSDAEALSRSL